MCEVTGSVFVCPAFILGVLLSFCYLYDAYVDVGLNQPVHSQLRREFVTNNDIAVRYLGNHLDNFNIDWEFWLWRSQLTVTKDDVLNNRTSLEYTYSAENDMAYITNMEKSLNDSDFLDKISKTIVWNSNKHDSGDSSYSSSCRPNFRILPAAPTVFDDSSHYALDNGGISYTNADHPTDKTKRTIKYININTDKYEWYSTSIVRDDLERQKYFYDHHSQWRYHSVYLTDVDADYPVEVSLTRNMYEGDVSLHQYDLDDTKNHSWLGAQGFIPGNRFLCVYSDGSTFVSRPVSYTDLLADWFQNNLIIRCPLSDSSKEIIRNAMQQDVDPNFSNNKNNGRKIDDSPLGLVLISLHPKDSHLDLINQLMISVNTQIPVCYKIIQNAPPSLYTSEKDYIETGSQSLTKENLYFPKSFENALNGTVGEDTSLLLGDDKTFEQTRKYFLSSMFRLRPNRVSGSQVSFMIQAIDFHLFQGFDHFYIYDHLYDRTPDDFNVIYRALLDNYINKGYVTYLHSYLPGSPLDEEQHCVTVNTAKLFKYDTHYLTLTDVDEWFMVHPTHSARISADAGDITLPTVREVYLAHAHHFNEDSLITFRSFPSMPRLQERLGDRSEEYDCVDNKYDTFLERQSCPVYKLQSENLNKTINALSTNDLRQRAWQMVDYLKINQEHRWYTGFQNAPKAMVDPTILQNGWMHFITEDNLNPNVQKFVELKNVKLNYTIYLHHLADHMRQKQRLEQFDIQRNPNDFKMFLYVSQPKCDFEDYVLYWNDRFLNSDFGKKYNNHSMVEPLLDRNAKFCFINDDAEFIHEDASEIHLV